MSKIIYTKTDEAPLFATYSLLPIIRSFLKTANIEVETKDISLSGRVIANFSQYLPENLRTADELKILGELTLDPSANIIKLPNISASIPQLKATILELQKAGYAIPDYPENPQNAEEEAIKTTYGKVLGSAVNPVLREGNSDRRAPKSVKAYAQKNPYRIGKWDANSKTHVSHMDANDFYGNEKAHTFEKATSLKVSLIKDSGEEVVLKPEIKVLAGEIIDATFMDFAALSEFAKKQIEDAKQQDVLFSLHLKATMMKVSDPVMFGCFVSAYFAPTFAKYASELKAINFNPNNGLGDLYAKIEQLPADKAQEIKDAIAQNYNQSAAVSMVNSDKGISNLHVPSDVIVDASMPAMIRNSGKLWDKDGNTQDTKAVIPDRTYARVYQAVIDDCKANGALDPATIGSVSNVGLMAQKAEEYGSHDKTFIINDNGTVEVRDSDNNLIFSHKVKAGDIYRMCQAKDAPIENWVELAVTRARDSQTPAIFWLDSNRGHDREMIAKVKKYLAKYDLTGLDISIETPEDATRISLARMRQGKDTISVTGNVLRDYNTDLFPILELGTSAKMLSIVPLMAGGGLFETGAGGSAPRHVAQLVSENHLRWDSVGEFLALGASLEHYAKVNNNASATILAETLDRATEIWLDNKRSPSPKVGELDSRGSHFYLAMYWANELAKQTKDAKLSAIFTPIAAKIEENADKIVNEINSVQGNKADFGGYYFPSDASGDKIMRPSQTLNTIINAI